MPIMQKMIPDRIVIFARDVQNITGRSERASRLLLQKIRQSRGKKPGQYISVAEFCQFTGLSEEEVRGFLKKWKPYQLRVSKIFKAFWNYFNQLYIKLLLLYDRYSSQFLTFWLKYRSIYICYILLNDNVNAWILDKHSCSIFYLCLNHSGYDTSGTIKILSRSGSRLQA